MEVLIPAWSMSTRAIKVQTVHNRNPNEHNWEGGCIYFHSSHLPHFSSIFKLQLAFKYVVFLWKVWLAKWCKLLDIHVGLSSAQVPFSLLFYRSVYSSIWLSNWVVNCERDSWLRRWFLRQVFLRQCDGSISCCTRFEWALCFSFMASLPR